MKHKTYKIVKSANLIILVAILYQLITGIFIIVSPEPIFVARLGIFYLLFNHYYQVGGVLMFLSAVLAIHALYVKRFWSFWLFIPQYFFLLLSAGSIVAYIAQQHYADGVMRPWTFIFIDQLLSLIVTGFYSYVILRIIKHRT